MTYMYNYNLSKIYQTFQSQATFQPTTFYSFFESPYICVISVQEYLADGRIFGIMNNKGPRILSCGASNSLVDESDSLIVNVTDCFRLFKDEAINFNEEPLTP